MQSVQSNLYDDLAACYHLLIDQAATAAPRLPLVFTSIWSDENDKGQVRRGIRDKGHEQRWSEGTGGGDGCGTGSHGVVPICWGLICARTAAQVR